MSANHIAAIHVLKAKLRLSDEDYRALLIARTGKASSKAMTEPERARVREHMQRLAETLDLAPARPVRADQQPKYKQAARPLERKVWALWDALGRAGKLSQPGPAGLQAWVKRQVGPDHVRFCSDAQLHTLIESLKLWQGR
ncbi:MAG: regulatory protein GemA [Pseudomonadota bacterium]|nr:regulatory protein GemA [Pseudomonadota bacterium]